jgi:hypothetical protein
VCVCVCVRGLIQRENKEKKDRMYVENGNNTNLRAKEFIANIDFEWWNESGLADRRHDGRRNSGLRTSGFVTSCQPSAILAPRRPS